MSSLVQALEQKYAECLMESDGSGDEGISVAIYVPCKSPRTVIPSLLVLNDCDIATAGDREILLAKCALVEELDLAKNKLKDWPEVLGILQQMPQLKFINLSFNHLSLPLSDAEFDKSFIWRHMRNLVLNSTFISWESVQKMLEHLPCLEELHLSLNNYSTVDLIDDERYCFCQMNINEQFSIRYKWQQMERKKQKYSSIRKFHFTGNLVTKWKEISKLGHVFPNLESLVVADCPIQSLEMNESVSCDKCQRACEIFEQTPHNSFKKLQFLNVNSTQLSTWNDIDKLSKFPVLHRIRIQGCPLWESNEYTEHERRQLLIARLPNVQILNGGGQIDSDEREDAERAFIRYYMDKPESDRPDRYFELVQIHGKLDPLINIDLRPEKRVKVSFLCGSNREVRSVDVYHTVSDLKLKLEGFAGFSASKMRLFYIDQDLRDIQGPEEMKYPSKQLYSYNIRTGDEIIVDCKKRTNY